MKEPIPVQQARHRLKLASEALHKAQLNLNDSKAELLAASRDLNLAIAQHVRLNKPII